MALNNYQASFRGLTFGLGTPVGIETIEGFEDWEGPVADTPVPREWGDIIGLQTVSSKQIVLELTARTDDDLNSILFAFQPSSTPSMFVLREPHGGERMVFARSIGRVAPKNPTTKFKKIATVRLKAADPRIYSTALISGETGVYNPDLGGMNYGVTDYGKDFVGATTTGDLVLMNQGTSRAYPVLKINGPQDGGSLEGATITNLTTGVVADFVFTSPLLATDVFTADMTRIITAAPGDTPYVHLGGVNRYGDWQLPRTPFYLAAKGESVIRYQITGTTAESTLSLTYRHTSL